MMETWYIRYPERLQKELQALSDAGYSAVIDEQARDLGRLVITVKYLLNGDTYDLVATFPESYPYFPFEITSPTFPGGRHKNQYTGSLCILKDPHTTWSASDDTLAKIISTQIPKIVQAHNDEENAHEVEAHEALQTSGQLQYLPGSYLFTGDWKINAESSRGVISVGIEANCDLNNYLRGAVLDVSWPNHRCGID